MPWARWMSVDFEAMRKTMRDEEYILMVRVFRWGSDLYVQYEALLSYNIVV